MSGTVRHVSTWQNVMNLEIDVGRKKFVKILFSTNDGKICPFGRPAQPTNIKLTVNFKSQTSDKI